MKRLAILGFGLLIGFGSPVSAATVEMDYTDLEHAHAPKVVNGVEYQYDANGNLVNDGERVISWNQDNLPVKIIKDGVETNIFYDANGQRIVKQAGENKTVYVNQYYQEPSTKYYFANGRIAFSSSAPSAQLGFTHQDHLGSTVLLTDSNSQKLTEPLSYFPYGRSTSNQQSTINNYLFTGQELDEDVGLYNYKARLYNPKIGSFISADIAADFNRYAYAHGNPLRFVDPTGRQYVDVSDWGTMEVGGFSILYSPTTSEQQRENLGSIITGALSYFDPGIETPEVPILLMDSVLIGQGETKRSYSIAAGWLETSRGAGFQIRVGEDFFETGRQEHWILHELSHIFDWKNKRLSLGEEFSKAVSTSDFYEVTERLGYGYASKYKEKGEQWRLSETFAEALAFYREGSEVMEHVPDLVEYFDQLFGRTEEPPSPVKPPNPVINYVASPRTKVRGSLQLLRPSGADFIPD